MARHPIRTASSAIGYSGTGDDVGGVEVRLYTKVMDAGSAKMISAWLLES